jgi:hypothetical protein
MVDCRLPYDSDWPPVYWSTRPRSAHRFAGALTSLVSATLFQFAMSRMSGIA